jgi:hypothetical protein
MAAHYAIERVQQEVQSRRWEASALTSSGICPQMVMSLFSHTNCGTNSNRGGSRRMTESTARQILALWPVVVGCLVFASLIAYVNGT